jgi:hypothetical protein
MRSGSDRRQQHDSDFDPKTEKRSGTERRSGRDRRAGEGCRRDGENGAIERRDAFREICKPKRKPDRKDSK